MKKIVVLLFLLTTLVSATDFYKPFIPIFPQATNGRYFKATVVTGFSAWLIYDTFRFERIQESRELNSDNFDRIWRLNMTLKDGKEYTFDSFTADSTFLGYRSSGNKSDRLLYTSYIDAANYKRIALEAEYTQKQNKFWLAGLYTYSFFDALDIYYKRPRENINSTDAMIKSIIIPGWGQIYSGSYSQAGFIYGMLIGFSGHAFYNHKLTNFYSDSILPEFQGKAEKYSTQRTTYLLYMLGIYLYNIVDAYVEGELSNFSLDISAVPPMSSEENISTHFSLNYLF